MANQKITRTHFVATISDLLFKQSKHFFMILSAVIFLILMFFSYKLWITKKEQSAQYDFSALITEYDGMVSEKNPQWTQLLDKFKKNYEKHAHSSLLPYYQGYAVNILLKSGDTDAALALLNDMIIDMKTSPFVALYEMKKALIQLDSVDTVLQNAGLVSLKNLATDMSNIFRDSAQFYLGRYYWATNQIELARSLWQQLIDEQHDEKIAASPWVSHVQELLKLTIV